MVVSEVVRYNSGHQEGSHSGYCTSFENWRPSGQRGFESLSFRIGQKSQPKVRFWDNLDEMRTMRNHKVRAGECEHSEHAPSAHERSES